MLRKIFCAASVPSARTDVVVIGLILAFTAAPTQVQLPDPQALLDAFSLTLVVPDLIANVLGYVPLGIVLANRPLRQALALAAVVSVSAEVAQLFCVGRSSSVLDIATNLMGASLGLLLASRWRPLPERVPITNTLAVAGATAAVAYLAFGSELTAERFLKRVGAWIAAPPWMASNPRGAVYQGILEAHWPFDAFDSGRIIDVSGNRLDGASVNAPTLTSGVIDSAVSLNGHQWIDFGNPVALRLTASMTLSAWIDPHAFPSDDAVIISKRAPNELGYQLDLTIDSGRRTIGFKVADASGQLMARYGNTPLTANHWYHVAGVYDAKSRTLDVYLNGEHDNDCLLGTITDRQHASGAHVFIGRRPGTAGFEFTGSIDDAKIYSRPLSSPEIRSEVSATRRSLSQISEPLAPNIQGLGGTDGSECHFRAPPRLAGPLVSFGMLVALACLGLWRGRNFRVAVYFSCLLAGSAASWTTAGIALGQAWEPILYTLAGGMIVVVSTWSAQRRVYEPDLTRPPGSGPR
jgi:VanZ family protein